MAASNKDTKFSGVFFQTERLIVRKWRDPDIEDMILGLNNERTAHDFNVPFPYSENDAKAYLQKTKNSKNGSLYFAVCYKNSNHVIGGGGIYLKGDVYLVGFWIKESEQKKGLGRELLQGVSDYVFDVLHQDVIYAIYYEWNVNSQKLISSCHFSIITEPPFKAQSKQAVYVCYSRAQRDSLKQKTSNKKTNPRF